MERYPTKICDLYNTKRCDEEMMIYVNGENENDTPLGRLMRDFKCTNPNDSNIIY